MKLSVLSASKDIVLSIINVSFSKLIIVKTIIIILTIIAPHV